MTKICIYALMNPNSRCRFALLHMRKFLFLAFSALTFSLQAQMPQISGFVSDAATGESIKGAIIADSSSFIYTSSNSEGFYNLGVSSGRHLISITASGYQRVKFILDVYNNRDMNVQLERLPEYLTDSHSNLHHTVYDYRSGHTAPLASQVNNMPALLNEQDPVKFLQYMPGVSGGIEGLAGLYVRGGNADQNLMLMDGLPVYGNGHIFGFLSNFNPGQIRDVEFYRGVMPARYGGRAGSVMDVSMLEGSRNEAHGGFESDILTLKFNINGPLNKTGSTTGSFGIRRSWLDLFLPKRGDNALFYNLHDINGKIVFRPGNNDKISIWAYSGRDKFLTRFADSATDSLGRTTSSKFATTLLWKNTLAGINYSHRFNNRLYSNVNFGMTRYTFGFPLSIEAAITTDTSQSSLNIDISENIVLTDFNLKAGFEYGISSTYFARFGVELINHYFSPSTQLIKLRSNGNTRIDTTYGKVNNQNAQEAALYGEWEMNSSAGLKLNVGGRLWVFSAREKTFVRPEPRILLSQVLEGAKAIKLGFGIANQGLHQLSNVNANFPNDVWFPSTQSFKPQQNIQLTGGFYQPWRAGIEFNADVYYKWMNGITEINNNDEGDLDANYWENMVAQGKGTAYGLELLAIRKTGRLSGLISYTYSKSTRTIEQINSGNTYPFRWDRRHKFVTQGVYQVNSAFMLNFALVLMSGNAVSVPTGKYVTADGTFIYDYSEKNNFRMPVYKRLDIGFKKQIHPNPRVYEKQWWGVNIYNVLNFRNPLFVSLDKDDQGLLQANGISFFPFIPSIFYKWEF